MTPRPRLTPERERALAAVEAAAEQSKRAHETYTDSFAAAIEAGCSLRQIAERAGTVVSNVHRIASASPRYPRSSEEDQRA